jgi:PAS domain S-box-containing protein
MHSTESHDSVPVALDATLRHLVESTDVGIWHIDTSGFTRYVNRAMCRLLEVESERELRGVHVTEFYSEAMRAHILPEFRKRMQGESSRYEAELTGRRGARHNVLLSGAPVLNDSGDVVGMVATFTDITQWKKSQQALLHQEYKYRLLMEQAGDAIFMNADDGRIEEVNAQACRLLGYSREELLTLRERDLLPGGPTSGHCTCFGEQDNRTIAHRECHMRCKDGALVPVEIGVTPISAQFHLLASRRPHGKHRPARRWRGP